MIEAIYFDLGDTLVAEETAVHDSSDQATTTHVIEGVFEVLEAIRKEGYMIGMIANGDSASARNIIEATGLQDYFDVIVISEEVGIEKPYQRIFEVALAKLSVKPGNAVMVDNKIDADILGANRAGIMVNPYDTRSLVQAMRQVLTDSELRASMVRKGLEQSKKFSWESTAELTLQVYNKVGRREN